MKKKISYRHYICIAITVICLLFSVFEYSSAFIRICEGIRDFFCSLAYYITEFIGFSGVVEPTVNNFSKAPLPFDFLIDWEKFQMGWNRYWLIFRTKYAFTEYMILLLLGTYYLVMLSVLLAGSIFVFKLWFLRIFNKLNVEDDSDSKKLVKFKQWEKRIFLPLRSWGRDSVDFLRVNRVYYLLWICIWALNFNVFTIVLEGLAYAFYLLPSMNILTVYRQGYKLFLDLIPMFVTIPFPVWGILYLVCADLLSRAIGYQRLRHGERCNRGFANERPIVTIFATTMGGGKTLTLSDWLLSCEVQMRDDALEILLECDMMFPNFPWLKLRRELRQAIDNHKVFDKWSCERWVLRKKRRFFQKQCDERFFGYDYKRYGVSYDDNLKVEDIWDVIRDYACAFIIYATRCSLLITNWSVRSDNLMNDMGNFPLWNCDFFARDSRLIDAFSRHSHILDFDMLRLGKVMLDNNPNRNALGFGCYGVTELDKERKNTPELQETRKNGTECNQKNDLFNAMVKMIRHAVVIRGRHFVRIGGDLQRPESLGADIRELGDIAWIVNRPKESTPVLPFFSPFWFFSFIYNKLKAKWDPFYLKAIHNRADNCLRFYLLKNIMAKLEYYHKRVCNLFGRRVLTIEVESGRMDGRRVKRKYYEQDKKGKAKRYSTDCHSGVFASRGMQNFVGIADFKEYADEMATKDELLAQHSHFQTEIYKYA